MLVSAADCLSAAVSASALAATRVTPSFGPLGVDALLMSASKRAAAVATCSPRMILAAAPGAGPLYRALVSACVEGADVTGDGAGARALMAAAALATADTECRRAARTPTAAGAWQAALARELALLAEQAYEDIRPACVHVPACWGAAACLVHTALCGSVAPTAVSTLARLVLALLRETAGATSSDGTHADAPAWAAAARTLAASPPVVASAGAAPLTASALLQGVVCTSGLARQQMARHAIPQAGVHNRREPICVAVLDAPLDLESVSDGNMRVAVRVAGADARASARAWKTAMLAERVTRLRTRGCALLLCTHRLSELAVATLDAAGIAAAMLVEQDEAERVARACGADVMPDNLPSTLEAAAMGRAGAVAVIKLGGMPGLCVTPSVDTTLRGGDNERARLRAHTLVVAAPSAALAGTYSRAVRLALRVVAAACAASERDGVLALEGGGGAAEMAIASELCAGAQADSPVRAAARRVLRAAAEAVPLALLRSCGDQRAVTKAMAALRMAHRPLASSAGDAINAGDGRACCDDEQDAGSCGRCVRPSRMGVIVYGAAAASMCDCAARELRAHLTAAISGETLEWKSSAEVDLEGDAWTPQVHADVLGLGVVHPAGEAAAVLRDAVAVASRLMRLGGVATVRRAAGSKVREWRRDSVSAGIVRGALCAHSCTLSNGREHCPAF